MAEASSVAHRSSIRSFGVKQTEKKTKLAWELPNATSLSLGLDDQIVLGQGFIPPIRAPRLQSLSLVTDLALLARACALIVSLPTLTTINLTIGHGFDEENGEEMEPEIPDDPALMSVDKLISALASGAFPSLTQCHLPLFGVNTTGLLV